MLASDLLRRISALSAFVPVGDEVLPCGLKEREAIDLMYRDLGPEDFDMLSKLDENVPKRDTVRAEDLCGKLPVAKVPKGAECGVCLAALKKTAIRLPCAHVFHQKCISKWLTECKNSCPICATCFAVTAETSASKGSN